MRPRSWLPVTATLLAWMILDAPSALAGTTASLGNFTAPLQKVVEWASGDIGRLVATLVLVLFGFYLWKSRNEDKSEKGLMFVLGAAIVLGAPTIINSLGFQGATY